jgi:ABC-type branched-subunit amino acid transport system substrate-binding protein
MKRRDFLDQGLRIGMLAGASLAVPAVRAADPLKVAVMIPLSGPAALFGPSSRSCSELAAEEINSRGGILGRPVELLFGDGGLPPAEATQAALKLWKGSGAQAFIGMHDSAVRVALVGLFKGNVPYIYTPTYEGGECARGTYVFAETPQQQLEPVIPWLATERSIKRWYFIGNDYVWPRDTNKAAKGYVSASGGQVVGEEYLPFTVDNFDSNLARIRESKADAVLVTLVGGASVGFNRSFASFGLADNVARLGTLIEENTLAGIGAQNSANLYSSSGYFGTVETPAARAFAARYARKFGEKAPPLNALAESCLEGLLLLEALGRKAGSVGVAAFEKAAEGTTYDGPRGKVVLHGRHSSKDIHLARAEGTAFRVVKTFEAVGSGQQCKA